MNGTKIKALTFDTGGTILDWHTGFTAALAEVARDYEIERSWSSVANGLRRGALGKMLNLGEHHFPQYNFDDAHRIVLDELCDKHNLEMFTKEDRRRIWWDAPHNFQIWPDFNGILPKLRDRFICVSFTILSFRIVIDTSRRNGLSWDAIISCEAIGKYKPLPEAYEHVAKYLQLQPHECCMVACHNFDLDAARSVGFKTAFVRRPQEWGSEGPPDPVPSLSCDFIVDDFRSLIKLLHD